ncbi:hypothetical protein [Pseudomonas kitaguniensis]|uniref:hypothetical protein n=1 Tax=Pseudomonas kitaguniensis TaxID=2607908 RepID=UPI003B9E0A74
MTNDSQLPTTARDALIIELLSDVGRLHDDIKAIPKVLELSMSASLRIVADAVEEAEKTSVQLQESTSEAVRATSAKAAFDAGAELSTAIHSSLERIFEPALKKASEQVQDMEKRLSKLSGSVRDTHATRFNYILLASFSVVVCFMTATMIWLAVSTQDANETNKWFYNEYKTQRSVIESLPPEFKKKFVK